MSTYNEAYKNAQNALEKLTRFRARWYPYESFNKFIEQMESHFIAYKEIWLTGHFSYSFVRRIKGLPSIYPGCDFRVLSIDPKSNKINLEALKSIKEEGGKVKIQRTLHARMFIGCNEDADSMCLIIGSYDYNREGISGENVNAGLFTTDPEMIKQAKDFFLVQWKSRDAQDI